MTIDETVTVIEIKESNVEAKELVTLENTDMIRDWGSKFLNMLVEASDLAKRVHVLQDELMKITNALTVANENAARAIAERDEAYRQRDRAKELQEQAEHAYQNVNEQRIDNERALVQANSDKNGYILELSNVRLQLADAKSDAEIWETEVKKLTQDVFNATSNAASMVDAVKAEKDAVISAQRLEIQALKDERFQLRNELDTNALDVTMLRKIIAEAKLANAGVAGVLEGTLAAE